MKIALNQADIINAIRTYISEQGIELNGKKVAVEFTAKRKGAGISAVVEITTEVPTAALTGYYCPSTPTPDPVQETNAPETELGLKATEPDPLVFSLPEPEVESDPVPAPVTKTTSLFG
jgi:hypothetical protein